jgi:selenium-binding protein 1
MFDGHVYLVDTANGTALSVFDCETIVPHVEVPVPGGMTQLLQINEGGDRLFFGLFQAGQVGMLDVSDPEHPVEQAVVSFGVDAGPHDIDLSEDGSRLVVTDYFLNEDDFGKVHAEGDHKVHVINVTHDTMTLEPRFEIDFKNGVRDGSRPAARDRDEVGRAGCSRGCGVPRGSQSLTAGCIV